MAKVIPDHEGDLKALRSQLRQLVEYWRNQSADAADNFSAEEEWAIDGCASDLLQVLDGKPVEQIEEENERRYGNATYARKDDM